MRILRHLELAFEWPTGADAQRDANGGGLLHFAQNLDGVAVRVLDYGVAIRDRDSADVEFRGIESEEKRETVVNPRISIDDDGDWGLGVRDWHAQG